MTIRKVVYSSQTYDVTKASFYALTTLVLLLVLVMTIARAINSEAMAVLGSVFVCLFPFIFQKKYKALFTRHVMLQFDEQHFLLKEYIINRETPIREVDVQWSELTSYKCSISSTNTIYIVVYCKDGSSKKFSFKDERNQEQVINEKSVLSLFIHYIMQYNLDKDSESKITLKPSFLTTKFGTIALFSLTIFAILGITTHFIVAPKTYMFSFMSFSIIMGLLVKRKTDKTFFMRIHELDPRFLAD